MPQTENGHFYRSLTRNIISIVILVSFTPLVLIAGLIGYSFETAYREKVLAHLEELVEKHQQNINAFVDEKISYIKVLADSYSYERLTDPAFLQNKLVILQNAYSGIFVDLGVINSSGVQISYAGNLKLDHADYSNAEWFREAVRKDYYISDVILGLRGTPHFIAAVKKRRAQSEWILRATIDFHSFNSLVENLQIGRTGSAFIVNDAGEFQTRPRMQPPSNLLSLLKKTPWAKNEKREQGTAETSESLGFSPLQPSLPANRVLSGTLKGEGAKYICILMPLKGGDWTLVYQQDENDAFSELNKSRILALSIFFLGSVGIAAMAFFLSRKVVRRIEEADREKELMNDQVIEAGKLASIGELAAGIAHEINNPVAIMVEEAGWMEDLLQEDEPGSDENLAEFRRSLKQIGVQGERCKAITHKLLSFARHTDPVHRDIQVNEVIEEILGILDQRSRFSNVRIESELDPGLPSISASPSELQQVFINLMNNALDAMGSDGGLLEVRSRAEGECVIV
ncbi:MAG: two-component sensor histidine kinase, partial [Desulfobacteraceae bacterium]|nr:two-component sensor histidine kinase [Desulfobacteraceae bacterium]